MFASWRAFAFAFALVALAAPSCGGGAPDGPGTGVEAARAGCKDGEARCGAGGGVCVDVLSSAEHCGACDARCEGGRACVDGACSADRCVEGLRACAGGCVDLSRDSLHCGACGLRCAGECGAGRCLTELAPTTPSVVSPAGGACTLGDTTTGRKVAMDGGGALYVLLACGARTGVSASEDGGRSFGAITTLDLDPTVSALVADERGRAIVVSAQSAGVTVSTTSDTGRTFSAPRVVGAPGADAWLGVARRGDGLLVATHAGKSTVLLSGAARGDGAFTPQGSVSLELEFGDLLVDPDTGAVWLTGDTPALHAFRSADGSSGFGADASPAAALYYSEWALGGGTLFAVGTGTTLARMSVASPEKAVLVRGLPPAESRRRALSAWVDGTLYVGSQQGPTGPATVLRVPAGQTSVGAPKVLSALGRGTAVLALSERLAFVAYATGGGAVEAAVVAP